VTGVLARIRAGYGALAQWIRVRHPYLSVFQPLAILIYVVCTWALCAVLAWALRGSPPRPLDPRPLTVAWLMLSIVASAGWAWIQWRARANLPRSVALPAAWSPTRTLLVIALLLSPTIVWERLAYARVRSLMSRSDIELVSGTIGSGVHFDWIERRAPPEDTSLPTPQQPEPQSARNDWLSHRDYRFCLILFREQHLDLRDRLYRIFPPDTFVRYRDACEKALQGEGPPDSRFLGITGKFDDPEAPWRLAWSYDEAGGVVLRYWELGRNQPWLVILPMLAAIVLCLSVVAPLVQIVRVLALGGVVCLTGYFVMQALPHYGQRYENLPSTPWLIYAIPGSVLAILSVLSRLWPRAHRGRWTDDLFVAVWLSPAFVLAVEAAVRKPEPAPYRMISPSHVLASSPPWQWLDFRIGFANATLFVFSIYLLASPFIPAAFSRYRRLPYDE
jgi:hypothetical protein